MVLIGAGTASGALVGLVSWLVFTLAVGIIRPVWEVPDPTLMAMAATTGLAAVLDTVRLAIGWPVPPSVGRQVPRQWSELLPHRVTAGLYGARLGVGPLTILSTWTWWTVTAMAAWSGPVTAISTGALFGFIRLLITAAISQLAAGRHPLVFGRLRSIRRPSWGLLAAASASVALITLTTAACAADPSDQIGSTAQPTLIRPAQLEDVVRAHSDTITTPGPAPDEAVVTTDDPANDVAIDQLAIDQLAIDEEPGDEDQGQGSTASDPSAPLADALIETIAGYQPIGEPDADRYLDLASAAAIQPDPTEEVALLETRGFRGGWLRAVRNEHNDVAVASVYHFDDSAEAEFYLEDGLITIGGYGGTFFDIPDLPGVRGFAQTLAVSEPNGSASEASDGELVTLGAAFSDGDRWFLLYFLGSPTRVTPDVLIPAVADLRRAADSATS